MLVNTDFEKLYSGKMQGISLPTECIDLCDNATENPTLALSAASTRPV
jgi:hypothetical protein